MNKLSRYSAAALCLAVLSACPFISEAAPQTKGSTVKPFFMSSYTYKKDFKSGSTHLMDTEDSYLFFNTDDPVLAGYKNLANALNVQTNKELNTRSKEYQKHNASLKNMVKNDPQNFRPYSFKKIVLPARADNKICSILNFYSDYTGANHNLYSYSAQNLDAQTGKELMLGDVISDTAKLLHILESTLVNKYPEIKFNDLYMTLHSKNRGESFTWVLTKEGINFYFPPYDLAPYSYGTLQAEIRFSAHPEIFSKKYLPADKESCIHFNFMIDSDVNGDGKPDKIYVNSEKAQTGEICQVTVNGKTATDVSPFYNIKTVLVKHNGRSYIYADGYDKNKIHELRVFDITGTPKRIGHMEACFCEGTAQDGGFIRQLMTDPRNFLMTPKYSTGNSSPKHYRVGDNGMPALIQ